MFLEPGSLADLVGPGQGLAGGGNRLWEQNRGLLKYWITLIIRQLRRPFQGLTICT